MKEITNGTGAAILELGSAEVYCHYSKQGETVKFRIFEEDSVKEIEGDVDAVKEYLPRKLCQRRCPLKDPKASYSVEKNPAIWREILKAYKHDRGRIRKSSPESDRTPVPVTRLRRYYGCLGELEKSIQIAFAKHYASDEGFKDLRRLWKDSFRTFEAYQNPQEWNLANPLKGKDKLLSKVSSTNSFCEYLMNNPIGVDDEVLSFVCRELNPWQTSGGVFTSGKLRGQAATKTGGGGMDLLLSADGQPVIGEVKVAKDKNSFYALIQSMAYAVEMATPSQFNRIKGQKEFKDVFSNAKVGVGIAVLLVNPVKDETLEFTKAIVEKINQDRSFKNLNTVMILRNKKEKWERIA